MEASTKKSGRYKIRRKEFNPLEKWSDDIFGSKDDSDIANELQGIKFRVRRDAEEFYVAYARDRGFDIRTLTHQPKRNCVWVCSCEGYVKDITFRVRPIRRTKRCGCMARLRVFRAKGTKGWTVTQFIPDHNHALCEGEERRFLKCNRYIAGYDRTLLNWFIIHGNSPAKSMDLMESVSLGKELPYLRKDVYNALAQDKRDLIKNGDFNTAFEILRTLQMADPGFVLEHRLDEKGNVSSVFWCDSQSKAEYDAYGDVLLMDSTYKTNKYRYPLVIFSGVSNVGRCLVFGAGLLRTEKAPSYNWILEKFLAAMNGKKPRSMLTDQDKSICKSVSEEYEGVVHRLCLWHMERNAQQNVKKCGFAQRFAKLAAMKCDTSEFDMRWNELVKDYNLQDDKWVKKTFDNRRMWSEAYFQGYFFAGLRTTGRAESINAFVKHYVKNNCTATAFVHFYHLVLTLNRKKSIHVQLENESTCRKVFRTESGIPALEMDAANRCTSHVFKMIRQNIKDEQLLTKLDEGPGPGNSKIYLFGRCGYKEGLSKNWLVLVDIDKGVFDCDCKLHESIGLPCSHLISCFKLMALSTFPTGSIHSRWFVETGRNLRILFDNKISQLEGDPQLFRAMLNVQQMLIADPKAIPEVLKLMEECGRRISEGLPIGSHSPGKDKKSKPRQQHFNVGDPKKVVSKGGTPKRPQCCSYCHVPGHNKVSCTKLREDEASRRAEEEEMREEEAVWREYEEEEEEDVWQEQEEERN